MSPTVIKCIRSGPASFLPATENAVAITGTVVLTRADGKTDALISDSEITNAKAVGAVAADTTYTYTVMGNVAPGAKAFDRRCCRCLY